MFDISYLPQLMARLGLQTALIFDDWDATVDAELHRRVSGNPQSSAAGSVSEDDVSMNSLSRHGSQILSDPGDSDFDADMDSMGSMDQSVASHSPAPAQDNEAFDCPMPSRSGLNVVVHFPTDWSPSDQQRVAFQDATTFIAAASSLDSAVLDEQLQVLTRDQLLAVARTATLTCNDLAKVAKKVDTLGKKLKVKQQLVRRLKGKVEKLNQAMSKNHNPLDVEKRKTKLTFRGYIALGCRKAMSVVSAQSFPLAGLVDVSRWSVTRSEVLIWAVCMARTRYWHQLVFCRLEEVRNLHDVMEVGEHLASENARASVDQSLVEVSTPVTPAAAVTLPVQSQMSAICEDLQLPQANEARADAWSIGSTFFAGDATNSSFWQRQKLQGLSVSSSVLVNVEALADLQYDKAFNTLHSLWPALFCE